jgi:tripartite-type tricarboxylate transporter receptor subunit TctC
VISARLCRLSIAAVTAAALAGAASNALSQQSFPTKPVRILVGFAPGGFTDLAARIIAPKLAEGLGQSVIVENRAGANGAIAAELTAKAAPDGHTIYMASPGHTTNTLLQEKAQYDAIKDFRAVSLVAHIPNILVVHPSVPARTVKELLALARSRAQHFTQASAGVGSPGHLSGALLQVMTQARFVHVPYKGSGPAMTDLISGQVDLSFPTTAAALTYVKSGKLRALGVTSAKRSASYPDVPTIAEAGVPNYEVVGWYGLIAPAGVPNDVLAKLSAEVVRVVKMPDVSERIANAGAEPVGSTAAEFAAFLVQDQQKWAKVIKAANLRASR